MFTAVILVDVGVRGLFTVAVAVLTVDTAVEFLFNKDCCFWKLDNEVAAVALGVVGRTAAAAAAGFLLEVAVGVFPIFGVVPEEEE